MRIEILTIFPEFFESPLKSSLLGKALEAGLLSIRVTNLRDFAPDRHKTVDDTPFGGGPGMVMKVEPIDRALERLAEDYAPVHPRILLTSASGRLFDQRMAEELSREQVLIVVCGRYKGVDERLQALHAVEELSIGNYVLTGGELAALTISETVARLLPGYMGKLEAVEDDAFSWGILGAPVYTQPQEYKGLKVPETLTSGHHARIREFRRRQALEKTLRVRPELLNLVALSDEDRRILADIQQTPNNPN